MSPLYAGAARVKLDPPAGLAMLGYGNRVGRNTGIHDDLAAQALVVSDGANKVAIAGVDVLALGVRIADDIRERVAASTGIRVDSILVCATHTHSAPAFNIFATPRADAKPAEGRDLGWERALPEKIASAIIQANENLEPATLRAAASQFTLGINRRLMRPHRQIQLAANRSGPADAEVQALGAYRANGTPIAFLMNYPCHGVVLCEDNLLYSRDWPGFAMDEIETAAASAGGPRPISIFIQGATGNIDPRSRGNFEVAEQTRPRDGPRRIRRAPARALYRGRQNRHAQNRAESQAQRPQRRTCGRALVAPPRPKPRSTTIAAATAIS